VEEKLLKGKDLKEKVVSKRKGKYKTFLSEIHYYMELILERKNFFLTGDKGEVPGRYGKNTINQMDSCKFFSKHLRMNLSSV
jgi:hypothetical protein